MMKRNAFKMYLKPGFEKEYEKRHNELWPEMRELLKEEGVSDYSIFWDKETNVLFAVQKSEGDGSSQDLGQLEIVQKWWAYMADIMETNPDNSPVSIPLDELFYMP
jgi:L-rhamnose mutarotase